MKKLILLLLVFISIRLNAQVTTTPIGSNARIQTFLDANPNYIWNEGNHLNKWGRLDTLSLPFFDEFTISSIYPDSSLWLNNQVYINNHFPMLPPSLGVASFDVLDAFGKPYYNTINRLSKGPGDSLISQRINLLDSAGTAYALADSIYLSFFIQANGYGYHLSNEDSIRLFFRNKFNNWVQVWSKGGQPESTPFEQIIIPVKEDGYLHKGFQFMFTTLNRQVGNANHWHIDYVLLDKGRSFNAANYKDYAIQTNPSPLLKQYYEMPYSHFVLNSASESADSVNFRISSLYADTFVMEVRHMEQFDGNVLVNTSFPANSVNLYPYSSSRRRLNAYNFYSSLHAPLPIEIRREIRIREAGIANVNTANDTLVCYQRMHDYFAYDDGTAEQGFGFDHLTNPSNIEGEIAYKFHLNKQDTLYAIGTFFNQSVFDVSRESFRFRVWQKIKEPGSSDADILLYESEVQNPSYSYSRNGFSYHYLDTILILPEGDFYIGWYQAKMFNLNVGWDKNFGGRDNVEQTSSKLFYKLFGSWSNSNLPEGTLMMRPFVGSQRDIVASLKEHIAVKQELTFYPNPANTVLFFNQLWSEIVIYNMNGVEMLREFDTDKLYVNELVNGIYFVIARNSSNQWVRTKLIIFAP